MIEFYKKNKEIIMYVIFGGCTTLINIFIYYISARIINLNTVYSTITAWIISVIFAYITNRIFVFNINTYVLKEMLIELLSFIGCRIMSGLIEIVIMYFFVDIVGINDMVIKTLTNILIIILNYMASKLYIFKK